MPLERCPATPVRGGGARAQGGCTKHSTKVFAKELQHSLPTLPCAGRVVYLGPCIIEEGVTHTWVDMKLCLLARTLELSFKFPGCLGSHGTILLSEESEHRCLQAGNVG